VDVPRVLSCRGNGRRRGKGYREFLVPADVLNDYSIAARVHWIDALEIDQRG
jgi:hypothetical protein